MKKNFRHGIGTLAARIGAAALLVCGGAFFCHIVAVNGVLFQPDAFLGSLAFRENQVIFPEDQEAAGQTESGRDNSDLWEQDKDADEKGKPQSGEDTGAKMAEPQALPLPEQENTDSRPAVQDPAMGLYGDIAGGQTASGRTVAVGGDSDAANDGVKVVVPSHTGAQTAVSVSDGGEGGSGGGSSSSGTVGAAEPSVDPVNPDVPGTSNTDTPSVPDILPEPAAEDTVQPSAEPDTNFIPSENMDEYDLDHETVYISGEGITPSVSEDGTVVTYVANFREANINYRPESAVYYSCPLTPYRLFCGIYATLIGSDGTNYIFSEYNENLIRVTGEYPEIATEPFETEFSWRINEKSEWQTVKVSYSVCPYKVSLRSYGEEETYIKNYCLGGNGLDGEEGVDYLFIPNLTEEILTDDCLEGSNSDTWREMTSYFPGWTLTADGSGEVLTGNYIPLKKGWTVLYPRKMQTVPDGLTVLYGYWKFDTEENSSRVQVLAANPCCECDSCWSCSYFGSSDYCYCECESCKNSADSFVELEVPEGIQVVCGMTYDYWDYEENEYAITADRLIIPSTVLEVRSVTVRQSYEVAEDNPVYSSVDGLLMDKAQTKVLAVPSALSEVHIPETAVSVELPEPSWNEEAAYPITDIYFTSETPPEIDLERLSLIGRIHLPTAELYNTYLIAWGTSLPEGSLVCDAGTEGTAEWADDNRILVKDGTLLLVNPDVAGAYIVPDSCWITTIAEGALDECSRLTSLVLPSALETVESGALVGESLKYVFFTGDTVPEIADDAFLTAGVPASSVKIQVPEGMAETYSKAWTEAGAGTAAGMIAGEQITLKQTGDGLLFGVCENGAMLLGVTDRSLTVFEPASDALSGGITLTEIEDYALAGLDSLTLAVVPETVERIGTGAFADCGALDGVMIDSDTLLLGEEPFDGCEKLRFAAFNTMNFDAEGDDGLALPCWLYVRSGAENAPANTYSGSVAETGEMWLEKATDSNARFLCTKETDDVTLLHATADVSGPVILPAGTTTIAEEAFYACDNSFWIPDFAGVTTIGKYAFQSSGFAGTDENGTLDLSESDVTSVEAYAFSICSNLKSVVLGDNITELPEGLFWDCPSLAAVPDLSRVTAIGDFAFQNCTGMSGTPDFTSLTAIGTEAFAYCPLTGTLNFGNELTEIGEGAFYECEQITGAVMPEVTAIGDYAFYDCWNLEFVRMPEVRTIGYMAFLGNSSLSETGSSSASGPELSNVETIGDYAFNACTALNGTLTLGEQLTSLGSYAFSSCIGLEKVVILGPVSEIPMAAFDNCVKLETVEFGENCQPTRIGYEAFSYSGLTEISVPESVNTLEWLIFEECENLTRVTFEGEEPPELDTEFYDGVYVFGFEPDDYNFDAEGIRGILEVPEGSEDAYVSAWAEAFMDWTLDDEEERMLSGINNVRLMLGLEKLDSLEEIAEEMNIDIISLGADPEILDEDALPASPSNAEIATASNWTEEEESLTEAASPSNWSVGAVSDETGEDETSSSDAGKEIPYKKEEDEENV